MKFVRIVAAGVSVFIFETLFNLANFAQWFSSAYKIDLADMWKPLSGSPSARLDLGALLLKIVLAYAYSLAQKRIPGGKVVKGLVFGICLWGIFILPLMLVGAVWMSVAKVVVLYWTIILFIKLALEGMIISSIYGE